jgi:hypothetical protein
MKSRWSSFFLLVLLSCETSQIKKYGGIISGDSTDYQNIQFEGIKSVSDKTDSTVKVSWNPKEATNEYYIFNGTPVNEVLLAVAKDTNSDSLILTNLNPGEVYKLRVRIKSPIGNYDQNDQEIELTMNTEPDMPSGVSLVYPAITPNTSSKINLRVDGVKEGDSIRIYTDPECKIQIGEGVASGDSIEIMNENISFGTYQFYANATNPPPTVKSSKCSTSSASYTRIGSCPINYALVNRNPILGTTKEFCISKYEMKNVGGVPKSIPGSLPWVNINQNNAKLGCKGLGQNYDLISNQEWMTTATELEKNPENWSSQIIGNGMMFRGHSDNSPSSALAITDENDPYNGTGNKIDQVAGSGKEQRRTLKLLNGETIWDFSGNVWEWNDWSIGGELENGPKTCLKAWVELPDVNCSGLSAIDFMPGNPSGQESSKYNSKFGLGKVLGGTGGAPLRGGRWSEGINAGPFNLVLSNSYNASFAYVGFRCVYRP